MTSDRLLDDTRINMHKLGGSASSPENTPDPLLFRPGMMVVASGDGTVFIRNPPHSTVVEHIGIETEDLQAVLRAVDGRRTRAEVVAKLSADYDPESTRVLLDELEGILFRTVSTPTHHGEVAKKPKKTKVTAEAPARILVISSGQLGASLRRVLSETGRRCELLVAKRFASVAAGSFRSRHKKQVLVGASMSGARGPKALTVAGLVKRFEKYSLVVCALQNAPYRAVLDINEAAQKSGVPVLYVTIDAKQVTVGPTHVPSVSACFECNRITSDFTGGNVAPPEVMDLFMTDTLEGTAAELATVRGSVLREVSAEVEQLLAPGGQPELLTHVKVVTPAKTEIERCVPVDACRFCGTAEKKDRRRARPAEITPQVALGLGRGLDRISLEVLAEPPPADAIKRVGIIGGGTAGYLTAHALKRELPNLEITLIESSEIPIIGVGEATTPGMVRFLHRRIGFDVADLYRRVEPTWKLGIKFFWGLPGDYYFNYPFGPANLVESYQYSGTPNLTNLTSRLMMKSSGLVVRDEGGEERFLDFLYAYHLDNQKFVRYLAEEGAARGIEHIDCKISEVRVSDDGTKVEELITSDGRRLSYDLYVDCTGFAARLIEGAMGSKYVPYDSSLYTDTAIVAKVPHGGRIKPYTLAESMDHGWCWSIGMTEADHRGYVYCSSFVTEKEALAEMRRKNEGMGDHRVVRFRCGRREDFWKGNVVAIGNSYGFVEPLESTALHMVIWEIGQLIENFPSSGSQQAFKTPLNKKVAAHWDYLRWFLSLHYRFNKKFDTPFWKHCREHVDISGIQELVDQYADGAPLSNRKVKDLLGANIHDDVFGLAGLDCLMLGTQAVPMKLVEPAVSRDRWERWLEQSERAVVGRSIPQKEALEVLSRRPSLLSSANTT